VKIKIMNQTSLSAREIELLNRLEYEGKDIYTRKDIVFFCSGNKKKGDYLIRKLFKKERLRKIIKNIYLFVPMKAPRGIWSGNEYLIAKSLARGARYYIGYATAFNSYGFTDQVAQVIHVANDQYSMRKTILGVRYKLIKALPNRFYGLETRRIKQEDVVFPTRERAMIDVFEFYDVQKAYSILNDQIDKLDMPLFIEYLAQYPVQKLRRRIGYFLEKLGVDKKILSKIEIGERGYSALYDTDSNKGPIDKRWRVIVNG
jgi:predicted transcriptional regulator of viral defense system